MHKLINFVSKLPNKTSLTIDYSITVTFLELTWKTAIKMSSEEAFTLKQESSK